MPFPILFGTTVTIVLHYRADCDIYYFKNYNIVRATGVDTVSKRHTMMPVQTATARPQ